jgi:hypothetical protein
VGLCAVHKRVAFDIADRMGGMVDVPFRFGEGVYYSDADSMVQCRHSDGIVDGRSASAA